DAAIRKRGNSPCTLLVCSGGHVSCVAHSFGVYARAAIANVAWGCASILPCNRPAVLVAGSPAIAKQLEMARIVHTLVSVSGYLAVRYSFRISGLLRSGGLPGFLVFSPLLWPICSRRPAMRGCVDVDLRYFCLLNRRGGLHRTFTLAPSIGRASAVGRTRDSAIRHATLCGTSHGSAQDEDGGGLKCYAGPHLPNFL